ncbi:MAG: hypothetical protein M3536_00275 [Actinomycetota bacterium]|nr:hypothetical protein [Actinomycetota bacterium]
MTKPRGIWATLQTECQCGAELTITNGRPDPHQCEQPISLAGIRAALGK